MTVVRLDPGETIRIEAEAQAQGISQCNDGVAMSIATPLHIV